MWIHQARRREKRTFTCFGKRRGRYVFFNDFSSFLERFFENYFIFSSWKMRDPVSSYGPIQLEIEKKYAARRGTNHSQSGPNAPKININIFHTFYTELWTLFFIFTQKLTFKILSDSKFSALFNKASYFFLRWPGRWILLSWGQPFQDHNRKTKCQNSEKIFFGQV